MSATDVFLLGVGFYAAGRLASGQHPFNVQTVIGGVFVAIVIAVADQGKTEAIAKGFAWLFFTVALLSALDHGLLKAAK
jgi:hypothetical protein